MEFNAINPFSKIKGINGVQQFQPVSPVKKAGADGGNPFGNVGDDSRVGLGIKDGAVQTSNGQMGKKIGVMRQLGIA